MGRRRSFDEKPKKKKRVSIDPASRMHAGKVIAPYRIMEDLINSCCGHLEDARIAIAWRKGWPSVNGRVKLGQMKMANDCDRAYKDFDFLLLLNSELYRTSVAGDESLTMTIHHCLLAGTPDLDRDGNQKTDEKDRLCWKIRKPPIVEFPEIIQTYGLEKTIGLTADALAALNDSGRSLLPKEDGEDADESDNGEGDVEGGGETDEDAEDVDDMDDNEGDESDDSGSDEINTEVNPESWRLMGVDCLPRLDPKIVDRLESAGYTTLGKLSDLMNDQGQWWNKEIGRGFGEAKATAVSDAFADFWKAHPEFTVG